MSWPRQETVICAFGLTFLPHSITSDVWSMALTVLEVALNRFPFPAPGEAPLQSPIELLTYLIKLDTPRVDDEPENGIKYTNAFRNFIQVW